MCKGSKKCKKCSIGSVGSKKKKKYKNRKSKTGGFLTWSLTLLGLTGIGLLSSEPNSTEII